MRKVVSVLLILCIATYSTPINSCVSKELVLVKQEIKDYQRKIRIYYGLGIVSDEDSYEEDLE